MSRYEFRAFGAFLVIMVIVLLIKPAGLFGQTK